VSYSVKRTVAALATLAVSAECYFSMTKYLVICPAFGLVGGTLCAAGIASVHILFCFLPNVGQYSVSDRGDRENWSRCVRRCKNKDHCEESKSARLLIEGLR